MVSVCNDDKTQDDDSENENGMGLLWNLELAEMGVRKRLCAEGMVMVVVVVMMVSSSMLLTHLVAATATPGSQEGQADLAAVVQVRVEADTALPGRHEIH